MIQPQRLAQRQERFAAGVKERHVATLGAQSRPVATYRRRQRRRSWR
jgi:hypothetical protein